MKNTIVVDFIERIVDEIDFTYDVDSFSNDGTDTTIIVCDLFHARTELIVTNDSVEHKILSVDNDTNTIVLAGLADTSKPFVLKSPFYFHGTPAAQNNTLSLIKSWTDKLPMVYLLEIFRESVNNDRELSLDRTAQVTLYFLDNANYEDWDTNQHYEFRINPMHNLLDKFIEQLNKDGLVGKFVTYEVFNHVKFGVYVTNKGHENSIFNEALSGCELVISIPIQKDFSCPQKCNC